MSVVRLVAPESLTLGMPFYSGFALFRHTLRSVAQQTYAHCRVLVVDDSKLGLTVEQKREIADILGTRFALRIVHNAQNLGMARTWNRCLDEAETDLVTIVHSDDELTPDYASEMVALASQHPDATAIFCGARIIGSDSDDKLSFPDLYKRLLIPRHDGVLTLAGDQALHSLMRGNYIFCPSLCYRRSRLGSLRFDPGYRMVLDMDLTTRVLLQGQSLVGVPGRALYRYRRHDENATEHLTKELTRFTEESAFYLDIARRASDVGFGTAARTAERRRIIKLNLLFCIVRDVLRRQWQDSGKKLRLLRTMA